VRNEPVPEDGADVLRVRPQGALFIPDKLIVFLGRTLIGHHHDYSMLKQELPPDLDWFADLHVRVDLGY